MTEFERFERIVRTVLSIEKVFGNVKTLIESSPEAFTASEMKTFYVGMNALSAALASADRNVREFTQWFRNHAIARGVDLGEPS